MVTIFRLILACSLLLHPLALSAKDAVFIDVAGQGEGVRLGLADFGGVRGDAQELSRASDMREVVKSDLAFARAFYLVEGGALPLLRKVNFDSWRALKADVLATGFLSGAANARFEFTGILYDVNSKQVLLEKRYAGDPGAEAQAAHKWADEIIKHFTGQSGIAGSKIYFVNNATGKKEICVVDYDGANFKRLTNDRSISLLPKVSRDGKWIAYTSFKDGYPNLYVMGTDGKQRRVLCRYEGLNSSAVWMPDGQSLIATLSLGREPNLYQVDLNGRIQRGLTNSRAADTAPALNVEGNRLAFTSDRPGSPQIYSMGVDGTDVRRLTQSGECDSPAWSPQGNLVAFAMSEHRGNFDIYTLDVVTGALSQLTRGQGFNENPSWSPDGRHIVFSSSRRGRYELWTMGFDGSNPQPLGNLPGQSTTPFWAP